MYKTGLFASLFKYKYFLFLPLDIQECYITSNVEDILLIWWCGECYSPCLNYCWHTDIVSKPDTAHLNDNTNFSQSFTELPLLHVHTLCLYFPELLCILSHSEPDYKSRIFYCFVNNKRTTKTVKARVKRVHHISSILSKTRESKARSIRRLWESVGRWTKAQWSQLRPGWAKQTWQTKKNYRKKIKIIWPPPHNFMAPPQKNQDF